MNTRMLGTIGWIGAAAVACGSMLLAGACSGSRSAASFPSGEPSAGMPGEGQPLFASDDDAQNAMLAAVRAQDHDRVHRILGPGWKELVSGDKVEDTNAFKEFARAGERTRLEKRDGATSIMHVGNDEWPCPIPIVKAPGGKWFFDTEAGKTEILARRIGDNELETISVCRQYVEAQRVYASRDRDGTGPSKYAERILSSAGKTDGLYWSATSGREPSPLASLFASAAAEGYEPTPGHPHQLYHGYHFRVLKRQGSAAPGGKQEYVVNGSMTGGFALVAFPEMYESSGIMTFIVNQQGNVYQKDLGSKTTKLARQMQEYDPDSTWALVKE